MKLALGTVQFGLQYGISNTKGIPSDSDLIQIFKLAKEKEISVLDTAFAYGNAESRISHFSKDFNIVTKFNAVETNTALKNLLEQSLQNLGVDSIYGYLAHNSQLLIENPNLWNVLEEEKSKSRIKKIGYSLYEPFQLEKLLDLKMIPDLVQLPYSIFDRKFEDYFKILKDFGTEIHIRSVFLQGLYFMNPNRLPEKLKSFSDPLTSLENLVNVSGKSIAEVALNFVYTNSLVDKIVIGVENVDQLKENIDAIDSWQTNEKLFENIKDITIEQKELLNPANW